MFDLPNPVIKQGPNESKSRATIQTIRLLFPLLDPKKILGDATFAQNKNQ